MKMSKKNPVATKSFYSYYRDYKIYKIVDAADIEFYNAVSDYVIEGFITVVGYSYQETIDGIDKVYQRKALLHTLGQHNR